MQAIYVLEALQPLPLGLSSSKNQPERQLSHNRWLAPRPHLRLQNSLSCVATSPKRWCRSPLSPSSASCCSISSAAAGCVGVQRSGRAHRHDGSQEEGRAWAGMGN